MRKTLLLIMIIVSCIVFFTSCVSTHIQDMANAVVQLEIGSSLDEVMTSLSEIEEKIPLKFQRSPIRYINQKGIDVFIYFVRTRASSESNLKEEVYTPLVFYGNILVGIGWESIDRAMN